VSAARGITVCKPLPGTNELVALAPLPRMVIYPNPVVAGRLDLSANAGLLSFKFF